MKNILNVEFFREVKGSLSRFLSILLIVALGVAFFSGIRATEPDMKLSSDKLYDSANMQDIRVVGELGLTETDLAEIKKIDGIKAAEGNYSVDLLWKKDTDLRPLKIVSLPKDINRLTLTEGRNPEKSGECLADERLREMGLAALGDKITLTGEKKVDLGDYLSQDTFTIVGFANSALYISRERGSTTVGNGRLEGLLYVLPEDFSMDVYTEIVAVVEGAMSYNCYSDEYDDLIDPIQDAVKDISGERGKIRYEEVQTEAHEKLEDAKVKIADAKKELEDAKETIEESEVKIADARDEIEDNEKKLKKARKELADGEKELADGRRQLDDGWAEYQDGVAQAVDGMDQLKAGEEQIAEGRAQLEAGYAQIDAAAAQLAEGKTQIESGKAAVTSGIQGVEGALAALPSMGLPEDQLAEQTAQLKEQLAQLQGQLAALEEQEGQIAAGEAELAASRASLDATAAYLDQQEAALAEGFRQAKKGLQKLKEAKETLEEKEAEYADGVRDLQDGKKKISDGLNTIADAKVKLSEGEEELEDGKKEYEEKSEQAMIDIADGEEEIRQAEEDLADMKVPKWYVLDRNTQQMYVEYGQNADRIGAIGKVFPVIFFLVAALVSLTTMTRMVEDERTQIGTMKAMGYSSGQIAGKYIGYAFLATMIGSVVGCVIGQKVLPSVIIWAYKIMYNNLPDVLTPLHLGLSVLSCGIALACTVGAAYSACRHSLKEAPAQLMRPTAPKQGKRIILERIPFLWNHMNFTKKSTARNLLRYKKRFFMTVFGISGCMALLIVGYGISDSLDTIADVEFGELRQYDASFLLEDDLPQEDIDRILNHMEEDERVLGAICLEEKAIDVQTPGDDTERSAYLLVPKDKEHFPDYFVLRQRVGKKKVEIPDEGIVITEKLAKLQNVGVGDELLLKEDESSSVSAPVMAIVENYYLHYIYMDPDYYTELFGEKPDFRTIYADMSSNEDAFEEAVQDDYMTVEGIEGVSFVTGISERIHDMLRAMDTLIWVLVGSAGLLAFVVLFNLNNINITERRRELATLRVLGFHHKEVSAYVFRENIVLTIFGAFAGLFLGTALHNFVIRTAEIDSMMFGRKISLKSYLISVILTFAFSLAVNGGMHFTLKKIDMVESLKSVE